MGYTKLFNEIIMSTVWREPNHVRLLWITMLALKDQYHTVNASLPGLADAARITLSECEQALEILLSKDKHSRSKEFEGRRISECDGGWLILNGEKYKHKMSTEERREYKKLKQREYRAKALALNSVDNSVDKCSKTGTVSTHTEEDTKEEEDKHKKKNRRFAPPSVSDVAKYCNERGNGINPEAFVDFYEANGWIRGKTKIKCWKACVRTWESRNKENTTNNGEYKVL